MIKDTIVLTSDTDWILPCIDCFLRIDAVREDKEACEADVTKQAIIIGELHADNKEWRERAKKRPWYSGAVGVLVGVFGTYFIFN